MVDKAARANPEMQRGLVKYAKEIRAKGPKAGKEIVEEYAVRFPLFRQLAKELLANFKAYNLFQTQTPG